MDTDSTLSNIVSSTTNFDFDSINLADPEPVHNNAGFYFTRLGLGKENEPLYFQMPECKTKQGVVSIKQSKYVDLMFNRSENNELMTWVEQLEYKCQDIINSKKELWFQTELTRDDIETMMAQMIRLYQSGKYMLIRSFIETSKTDKSINCIAYDENEFGFDLEKLQPEQSIIPLLLIEGVKFSSRSFEISLKIIQVMVIGDIKQKTSCLIKRNKVNNTLGETNTNTNTNTITEKESLNLGQLDVSEPQLQNLKPIINSGIVLEEIEQTNDIEDKSEEIKSEEIKNEEITDTLSDNDNSCFLEEITLDIDSSIDDSINLKNPNEVYYEIYKKARENAEEYRTKAMESYLEAKRIKTKYMLFDIDESDDSDDENNNFI